VLISVAPLSQLSRPSSLSAFASESVKGINYPEYQLANFYNAKLSRPFYRIIDTPTYRENYTFEQPVVVFQIVQRGLMLPESDLFWNQPLDHLIDSV
jgi:hypothetical protein